MATTPFKPESLSDTLADFELGVNSGVSPLLLPKNQLADASNVTVRGTFATHRPPIRQINLSYGGNAALQAAVESALFQGGSYFAPDGSPEVLMASIAGRIFQFTPDAMGDATVLERVIPGGNNPADRSQVWMWQSESWTIVDDGISIPLFIDSGSVRRSLGAATSLGTVAGGGFVAPAVGATVAITLSQTYTGPFGVNILIGSALYEVTSAGAAQTGFNYTFRNDGDTPGNSVTSGTAVKIDTGFLGFTTQNFNLIGYDGLGSPPGGSGTVVLVPLDRDVPNTVIHQYLSFDGQNVSYIYGVANNTVHNVPELQSTHQNDHTINAGASVRLTGGTVTPLGNTCNTFVVPAVGATVPVCLTQQFNGPFPQSVLVGGKSYTIMAAIPTPPNTVINAINVNDNPGNVAAGTSVSTIAELQAGRMGVYGMGRNWYSLPDALSFRAGDIVGSSSGTLSFQFRDAVLKESHNQFLTTGDFRIPGANGTITAMRFIAILDTSLGQGPLQVLTPSIVFSCAAPVDDTKWQALTNPILTETLKPKGGLGQNSTVNANSDLFFRAPDGLRSLILGQRQFSTWGNVAQSFEVSPTLDLDNQALLAYSSAVNFDNRLLLTSNPVQGPNGVYHDTLIALNFDPVSSLQGKADSVYDGVWNGLSVLQLVVGQFSSVERCFAFCFNRNTSKTELWEILTTDASTADGGGVPITWEIVSPMLFKGGKSDREYKQLEDGEIYVDELVGTVQFTAYYKPDQWPNWVLWHSWSETNDPTKKPGFRPRMGLGQPSPNDVDVDNDRPLRNFYNMQFRLVVTGHCQFLGGKFGAVTVPQPMYAKPL